VLAKTFNTLAERIADEPNRLRGEVERRTEELRAANTKLQALVREVQENATQVLKKERELVEVNESLAELNHELERVGKALRKRERELTLANKRLEEIDSTKSEFVSVAAHQLRTPLTGIRWALKGLANKEFGNLNSDQLGAIKSGLTAAESAINLINDLLDIARIEEGRYGFHFTVAPLAPVLAGVIERQQRRADKKGIALVPPTIDASLCVKQDAERLGIAIENAVDNAIKYTPPKGTITVRAEVKDKRIEVHVQDSGIGIPIDQQHRLFSKFFRAPNAMLMQTAGTGLGLYLMQNIVKRHNGSVYVKSAEGKGTTIIFSLPLVSCADASEEEPGDEDKK
jgi:signal transduction histidine kinase